MTVRDMMDYQRRLQEKYKGVWEGDAPETAQHHLLYAVEEIGEVSAILRKRGAANTAGDPELQDRLCEEMADVFMFLNDVMICENITPEQFEAAYLKKMEKNLQRDFVKEHSEYIG